MSTSHLEVEETQLESLIHKYSVRFQRFAKTLIMIAFIGIFAILFLFLVESVYCETEVSGDVSGEWNPEGSPYILIGNAIVPEGEQLVILPGTEVRADGFFHLGANGEMVIQGTPGDSILFTSNADDPAPEDWRGVSYSEDMEEEPEIAYAIFEYAYSGLWIPFGEVRNCTFRNCVFGINAQCAFNDPPAVQANNNYFLDNNSGRESGGIILINNAVGDMRNNLFVRNSCGVGICTWGGEHYIVNNTFVDTEGIAVSNQWGGPVAFVYNNIISGAAIDVWSGICRNNNSFEISENAWVVGEIASLNGYGIPQDNQGDFSADPRFIGGEPFSYRLRPDSPCIDTGWEDLGQDQDGTRIDLGAFPVMQEDEYELVLPEGWNMISFPLWIQEQRIDYYLRQQNFDLDNLLFLKNDQGQFWAPEFDFINLSPHDHHKGYLLNMEAEEILEDVSVFITSNEPIPVQEGWQITAYYPEIDLEAPAAFESIVDNLIIAKDDNGRFYFPEFNFNNMPALTRGKGYLLKMTADDVLIYPDEGENRVCTSNRYQTFETNLRRTDNNMCLLLLDAMPGELYTVKTSEDRIVGRGIANDEGKCGIAVWGDDSLTDEIDGATDQERLLVQEQSNEIIYGNLHLKYSIDDVIILSVESEDRGYLLPTAGNAAVYPNPMNDSFVLSIDGTHLSKCNLRIFSVDGREVWSKRNISLTAGTNQVNFTAQELALSTSAGIYFLEIQSEKYSFFLKINYLP